MTAPAAPEAEAALLTFLDRIGVAYALHRHGAVFTVEQAKAETGHLPGAHVKNMFLKDRRGALWLVTCGEDRAIRLRDLEKELDARKFSFASAETLAERLGVAPGSVTPLAVINDRAEPKVRVVLDAEMMAADLLNVHPLHNEATLALTPAALRAVFAATGHEPVEIGFDALETRAAAAQGATGA